MGTHSIPAGNWTATPAGKLPTNGRPPHNDDMDKIARRRQAALAHVLATKFGGSQAELARAIARSPSTVWRLLSNGEHTKPIGEHLARDIELRLGLPPYHLDGVSAPVAQALRKGTAGQDVYSPAAPLTPRAAPLIREADAAIRAKRGPGAVREVGAMFISYEASENAWGLVVASDAMWPLIQPGDRVLIDPDVAPEPGDVVLALLDDSQALLRRLRAHSSQLVSYELVPANQEYSIVRSLDANARMVGTMVEHHRLRSARRV